MELIIPFMLIVVQWHPEHSGEFIVARQPALYLTQTECEQAGLDYIENNAMVSATHGGARFTYKCLPVPQVEEYDAVFGHREIVPLEEDREAE